MSKPASGSRADALRAMREAHFAKAPKVTAPKRAPAKRKKKTKHAPD